MFLKFYAPWCGHCKRLEPMWLHVAQALHNTDIRVGRVDCTRYKRVVSEFGLSAYPTIMLYVNSLSIIVIIYSLNTFLYFKFIYSIKGNEGTYNFNGERSTEEMVHFAKRMARPPVQEVTDPKDIEMLKQSHKIFFMFIGESVGDTWVFNQYYFLC